MKTKRGNRERVTSAHIKMAANTKMKMDVMMAHQKSSAIEPRFLAMSETGTESIVTHSRGDEERRLDSIGERERREE
jgi:hypothetical protein